MKHHNAPQLALPTYLQTYIPHPLHIYKTQLKIQMSVRPFCVGLMYRCVAQIQHKRVADPSKMRFVNVESIGMLLTALTNCDTITVSSQLSILNVT